MSLEALESAYDESIAYSVACEWGAIRVTKEAVEAYDLAPNPAATVARGDFRFSNQDKAQITTDVCVLGPNEAAEELPEGQFDTREPRGWTMNASLVMGSRIHTVLGLNKQPLVTASDQIGELGTPASSVADELTELAIEAATMAQDQYADLVDIHIRAKRQKEMKRMIKRTGALALIEQFIGLDNKLGAGILAYYAGMCAVDICIINAARNQLDEKIPVLITGTPDTTYAAMIGRSFHNTFGSGKFVWPSASALSIESAT